MSTLIFNTIILTVYLRFNFKLKIQYQSYKDKYNQAVSGILETNFDAITECSKKVDAVRRSAKHMTPVMSTFY